MGLEVAAVVLAGVSVASKIGQAEMQSRAADEREAALNLQAEQQTLQNQQKTLSNYDVLKKALAAQEAQMTVRGAAFSSPSFNAIQRDTINIAGKRQKNIDIEGDLSEANIDIEKSNVRNTLYAQLFGDAADIAMSGASFLEKMPKKGK